ncbi:MAG: SDR family oxidoreductase [Armatimonadetes bacterium]|nr:SDR family oxidoreductase [Armatimonadota bacterium]
MNDILGLNGKVAVITGGLSPIGASTGLMMAQHGADILALDIIDEKCPELISRIESIGQRALYMQCDVTDTRMVAEMCGKAKETFGRVDILLNNAASAELVHVEKMTDEQWDRCVAVSLRGSFLCSREIGKIMMEQRSGCIISIASIAALIGLPRGTAHHAAAKAGIIGFTKTLAVEWAKYGIRVNVIAPGQVNTPALAKIMSNPDYSRQILESIPMGRVGTPEEIAAAALFLASDASGFINGHTLVVDGGATIY